MKTAKLQVFRAKSGARRWYVRLRYGNGRKAMVSEGNGYTRLASALRAARAVKRAIPGLPIYYDGERVG